MDKRGNSLNFVCEFIGALIYLSIFLLLVKTVVILCYEQSLAAKNKD
tara:strand:+ start:1122 stop:1262 length:141 start_codon:yes stop_codon:yes gene_type:complete